MVLLLVSVSAFGVSVTGWVSTYLQWLEDYCHKFHLSGGLRLQCKEVEFSNEIVF